MGFQEEFPEETQPLSEGRGLGRAKYGSGALRPAWERHAGRYSPVMHYQLACVEALAGNRERALDELAVAVEGNERYRDAAKTDEDFASIRDDPRFPA